MNRRKVTAMDFIGAKRTSRVSACLDICTSRSFAAFERFPWRTASRVAFRIAASCLLTRVVLTQSVKKWRTTELMIVVKEPARRIVRTGYAAPNPLVGHNTEGAGRA